VGDLSSTSRQDREIQANLTGTFARCPKPRRESLHLMILCYLHSHTDVAMCFEKNRGRPGRSMQDSGR
jgi:hypothetical protein